jgi:hypothetical protein
MKNDTEELVDRYLQAVRFWLPKAQRQDIIAELSEELRSQIEEKETALGRKLNQSEAEAILKQLGRPVLVANRYLPQQYLIGPVLFPIYKFVLKIVALCYLVPWILVWIGFMRFDRGYRAQHGPTLLQAAGSLWGSLWFTAFICAGVVTIVFAVLERSQGKSGFLAEWDPGKLPAVRDPNQISRATSIFEVVANAVFCLWWIDMWPRFAAGIPELRITLAPAWRYFYWGALFVALAQNGALGGKHHPALLDACPCFDPSGNRWTQLGDGLLVLQV